MPHPGSLAAVSVLLLVAPSIQAQTVYTLDATGVTASYAGAPRSNGLSISPALQLDRSRLSFAATSNISYFDDGGWTAQGFVSAAAFTASTHLVRGEFAATANGIAYPGGGPSAYAAGEARLHIAGATGGGWLGGGFGGTQSRGSGSPLVLTDIGGWWRPHGDDALVLTGSFTQSRFHSGGGAIFRRDRILNDAVGTVHWERGLLEFDGILGARLPSLSDGSQQWATLSAALWVTHNAAIVVSGGKEPESFVLGFPSERYLVVGLRLASQPHARAAGVPSAIEHAAHGSRSSASVGNPPPGAPAQFTIASNGARRVLCITIPDAQRVELAADFTNWKPVSLSATSVGVWQLAMPIAPGTYLVSIRVNGGAWEAPPGVPARHDEFGTAAGVVVID